MTVCKKCKEDVFGGTNYSFENDEREYIGLPKKESFFLCHKCDKGNTSLEESEAEILRVFKEKGLCGEMKWYQPRCRNKNCKIITHFATI